MVNGCIIVIKRRGIEERCLMNQNPIVAEFYVSSVIVRRHESFP